MLAVEQTRIRAHRSQPPAIRVIRFNQPSYVLAGQPVEQLLVLFACVLFRTTADKANVMGKMCLFSAVNSMVLEHDKPVEGATVERGYKWMWNDQVGNDATTTDSMVPFRCR